MLKKNKEHVMLGITIVIIVLVAGFPLLAKGIGGDIQDLTYHLLRIESVKEALVNGCYPARVNPIYMDGYGYGSSLFYPDIFLVIPAFLNIVGIPLLWSYKIFVFLVMIASACTTYFALKFISGDWKSALVGCMVLMLSNYYLADINNRSGISEYLACVFVPVLVAGIYDYFACRGERTYLLGIAFVGLVLSHTIMTFIGVVVTGLIFVGMLLVPGKRRLVFERGRFWRLFLTAVVTALSVSYYILPMLEQFVDGWFRVGSPWAMVGDYTQTVKSLFAPVGVFVYTAQFGVGVALLLWVVSRVALGKLKNRWADFFLVGGLLLLLVMTDVVPWELLENTPFNMIQFTYRFYPYALFFLVCGMTVAYAEKAWMSVVGRWSFVGIAVLAVVCGIWQNKYCYDNGTRTDLSKEFVYENNHWVGHGEWFPSEVSAEVCEGRGDGLVYGINGEKLPWLTTGYSEYEFSVAEETGLGYTVPLIYYKGYEAGYEIDGEWHELQVSKSPNGLVRVDLDQAIETEITVRYEGTVLQRISDVISLATVIGVACFAVWKVKKRQN